MSALRPFFPRGCCSPAGVLPRHHIISTYTATATNTDTNTKQLHQPHHLVHNEYFGVELYYVNGN